MTRNIFGSFCPTRYGHLAVSSVSVGQGRSSDGSSAEGGGDPVGPLGYWCVSGPRMVVIHRSRGHGLPLLQTGPICGGGGQSGGLRWLRMGLWWFVGKCRDLHGNEMLTKLWSKSKQNKILLRFVLATTRGSEKNKKSIISSLVDPRRSKCLLIPPIRSSCRIVSLHR